jgi:hypothetical protein
MLNLTDCQQIADGFTAILGDTGVTATLHTRASSSVDAAFGTPIVTFTDTSILISKSAIGVREVLTSQGLFRMGDIDCFSGPGVTVNILDELTIGSDRYKIVWASPTALAGSTVLVTEFKAALYAKA